MEIVTTVVNPINDEEVEITLNVSVIVSMMGESKILNVHASGSKEV